ncbi:hypothetical protein HWV62_1416 [Athelia sp. TMB]|nr:hypothetical protein HWV62_1416 [Athelia sp. TMB]
MAQQPPLNADPHGWERAWQAELAHRYSAPGHYTRLSDLQPPAAAPSGPARFKELCALQADLSRLAAEKCATADFEGEWRRRTPEERKRHYMAAMRTVCEIPDMEKQRRWVPCGLLCLLHGAVSYAPEVTLTAFEAGSGQGYLDTLRKIVVWDSSNNFVHLENPLVESMLGIEPPVDTSGEQPADPTAQLQKISITNRTLFITLVVWHILLSFYGETATSLLLKGTKGVKPTLKKMAQLEHLGTTVDIIVAVQKEIENNCQTPQSKCNNCGKLQTASADVQFKSCSKCSAAGACTRYCSRECQVADWKTGTPPHKTVCGQSATLREADPTSDDRWAAAPEPGFRRPPALLHQMRLLNAHPSVDYFFVQPHPLDDYGAIMPTVGKNIVFAISRRDAMNWASLIALGMMFDLLAPFAEMVPGMDTEILRRQLANEYGVDEASITRLPLPIL